MVDSAGKTILGKRTLARACRFFKLIFKIGVCNLLGSEGPKRPAIQKAWPTENCSKIKINNDLF